MARNHLAEFYSRLPRKIKKHTNRIIPSLSPNAARGKKALHDKIDRLVWGKRKGGRR